LLRLARQIERYERVIGEDSPDEARLPGLSGTRQDYDWALAGEAGDWSFEESRYPGHA
jgi:hypothetical protein